MDNTVSGFGGPAQNYPGIIQSQFGLVTATTASQADLATWTARFQAGAAVSDLHTALAHSPQAEAAIGRILAQDFGRAPTKAELKTSVAFLAQGATLQDLDSQTLASITPRTVASPGKTGGIAPNIATGGGSSGDPVAYWHDRFESVRSSVGQWLDYNAAGGQTWQVGNVWAGIGGAYNLGPKGFASSFQNIRFDHSRIAELARRILK